MTAEDLIAEGRRLSKPCAVLRALGDGPVVAYWYEKNRAKNNPSLESLRLTVETQYIPGFTSSPARFLTVFVDERELIGGRVVFSDSLLEQKGVPLYAFGELPLPPVDVIEHFGSESFKNWFEIPQRTGDVTGVDLVRDRRVLEGYQTAWFKEYPVYKRDSLFAVLGGWHCVWPEGEWEDFLDEQMLLILIENENTTYEVWKLRSGEYRVIPRSC